MRLSSIEIVVLRGNVVSRLEVFSQHRLVKVEGGPRLHMWRCEPPGGGVGWFDVISCPGRLIIAGDFGDQVLKVSGWGHAFSSPPSPEDFASKMTTLPADAPDRAAQLAHLALHHAALATFLRLLEDEQASGPLKAPRLWRAS